MTGQTVDVMIYVQHLLGIGHLTRAAAIARACDAAGLSTTLVSGGAPLADLSLGGARLAQLPPLRSRDADFSALVDQEGREIDETFKQERRVRLLSIFAQCQPKVLIIELYPFGRRMLRFELEPLTEAAQAPRPRPWVLCSLRDVLNPSGKPTKTAWTVEQVRESFDQVLVHGDPDLIPLEASFPGTTEIAEQLRYTGYIVEAIEAREPAVAAGGEVVVSTGGGAVGRALVETALAARALSPLSDAPWRILVGRNLPEADFQTLQSAAASGVVVERARPDFRSLLARARLSISQAGYNTALEVVQTGVPAVFVPFETESEQEQRLRASRLAERGLAVLLPSSALSPERLALAVGEALSQADRGLDGRRILADGARNTARIVTELAAIVPG